jgi:hypothetical protein
MKNLLGWSTTIMLTIKQCALLEGAGVYEDFGQISDQFYMNR